jgi:hypothetical protein
MLYSSRKTLQYLGFLLNQYFMRLPKYAFEQDIFYLRPKSAVPASDSEPWYECIAVGKNTLATMVKWMCQDVGIEEKNIIACERLELLLCSRLIFQSESSRKQLDIRRSLQAIRCYERISADQHREVSNSWCLLHLGLLLSTLLQNVAIRLGVSQLLNRQCYCKCLLLFQQSIILKVPQGRKHCARSYLRLTL